MTPHPPRLLGFTPIPALPEGSAVPVLDESSLTDLLATISEKAATSDKTIILDEAWKLFSSFPRIKFPGKPFSIDAWEKSQLKYLTIGGVGGELVRLLDTLSEPAPAAWLPNAGADSATVAVVEQSESGVLVSVEAPYTCSELSTHLVEQFPLLSFNVSLSR